MTIITRLRPSPKHGTAGVRNVLNCREICSCTFWATDAGELLGGARLEDRIFPGRRYPYLGTQGARNASAMGLVAGLICSVAAYGRYEYNAPLPKLAFGTARGQRPRCRVLGTDPARLGDSTSNTETAGCVDLGTRGASLGRSSRALTSCEVPEYGGRV